MQAEYDVIVCGGGTAGVIAAIQAGRAGARTLLIEKNGMLGGTVTVGGINAPAHFFAWGTQIIGGIGWELMRKTLAETGKPIPTPDFTRENNRLPHLSMDKAVFAAICDMAVLDAGVELLFHAMPGAAQWHGLPAREDHGQDAHATGYWTLTVCTKTGLRETRATVLIDATGDANVVELAGFDVVCPETVQPATLVMHCAGYDAEALDYAALLEASKAAIAAGELITTDISWGDNGPEAFLRSHGHNANHLRAPKAETSEGKTAAEVEARQAMLRMYRFCKQQPGLENFRIDWVCTEVGIRETVTINGKSTVTAEDYEMGRVFDDALCYAFYPIDEHLNDGKGINFRLLNRHVLPTIPRGALLPKGSRNLIVAGRTVSSDRLAHSALRVECPCMAMGQAAGAMAALTARTGLDPEYLPLADIYALLHEHDAVVPGDVVLAEPAAVGTV